MKEYRKIYVIRKGLFIEGVRSIDTIEEFDTREEAENRLEYWREKEPANSFWISEQWKMIIEGKQEGS